MKTAYRIIYYIGFFIVLMMLIQCGNQLINKKLFGIQDETTTKKIFLDK